MSALPQVTYGTSIGTKPRCAGIVRYDQIGGLEFDGAAQTEEPEGEMGPQDEAGKRGAEKVEDMMYSRA